MTISARSKDNPLSGFAASPFSRIAERFGKEDDASAAGRPLRGVPWLAAFLGMD